MQTTILFNTPMRIDSIFQSASVIEFQEHGNIHNTMFVRLDVEPYAPHIVCATDPTEYIAVAIDKNGTVYGTTTDGKRVPLTKTPYSTPESATLTQVGEMWVGSRYRFYADEDTTFTDEETGEQVSINSDDIEDNLPVGATITMRDKYTPVTVRRTGERSYNINGSETDHCGTPYDAGDALDFIFKWYGTCTRHTITRP
jgi:hypothetical protein